MNRKEFEEKFPEQQPYETDFEEFTLIYTSFFGVIPSGEKWENIKKRGVAIYGRHITLKYNEDQR